MDLRTAGVDVWKLKGDVWKSGGIDLVVSISDNDKNTVDRILCQSPHLLMRKWKSRGIKSLAQPSALCSINVPLGQCSMSYIVYV